MTEDKSVALYDVAASFEAGLLHGRYDPDRAPVIPVRTFEIAGRIEAAAGPDASYSILAPAISSATDTLDIYIYNLTGTRIAEGIADRLAQGVSVRILYDVNDMRGGEAERIEALRAGGAIVRKAPSTGDSSVFTVCHQKLCISDQRRICLGSANWGPSGFPDPVPQSYARSNREWVVSLDDRPLAQWWTNLFQADLDVAGEAEPQDFAFDVESEPERVFRPVGEGAPPGPFPAFHRLSSAARATPVPSPDAYLRKIAPLLESAGTRILIQQQYILPSPSVDRLLSLIEARRTAGVEVKVIVSPQFRKVGRTDNWELSQQALRAHNMEDRLRAMNIDVFSHLHNKGLVVDDKVVISSTNWSENSLTRAREAGLIIEDRTLADYFAEIFEADWAIAWPSEDVRPNMADLLLDAAITPGGLEALPEADLT